MISECMPELILCVLILIQALLHRAERRDLYDRLMCRDVNDYKQARARDKPGTAVTHRHEQVMKRWRDRGEDV